MDVILNFGGGGVRQSNEREVIWNVSDSAVLPPSFVILTRKWYGPESAEP